MSRKAFEKSEVNTRVYKAAQSSTTLTYFDSLNMFMMMHVLSLKHSEAKMVFLKCRPSMRTWELEEVFRSTSAQDDQDVLDMQLAWHLELARYVGRNRIHLRGITEGFARGNKRHIGNHSVTHGHES